MGVGVNPNPNQNGVPNRTVILKQLGADDFGRGPRGPRSQGGKSGDERQRLELERQRMAEQIAREQQARAEAEFRQQQAQAEANAQAKAGGVVVQLGNRGGRQRPDQEARRRDLDAAARARQEQMIAFEREMAAAKQAEERMRKDAKAARGIRGTEGDARLQEEAKLRQEQEAMFEARLREAEAQYRAQANQPGRRVTPKAERQAQMISEFERARKQAPGSGRDQAIAEFERRFQGEGQQPAAGITSDPEGAGVLSYQELLNRLKQYQGGMA